MINRIADRIDLAIDLLTLGQYGLQIAPEAATPLECARSRQSLGRARRVACERPRSSTTSAGCQ